MSRTGVLQAAGVLWFAAAAVAGESPPVSFPDQIAPLLAARCVRCHRPGYAQGEVSLATPDDLTTGGYVAPGDPEGSRLMALVAGSQEAPAEMPAEGAPLTGEETALLRRWIAEGAEWPVGFVVRERTGADASWWSLQPLDGRLPAGAPRPPEPSASRHPIDLFLQAALAAQGLEFNPPADRRTLIRRATFDLLGLPPTPEETAAFVADERPDAYERLIDRLLDSPHYGEQWGRHWLDVVRFGESNGYERNFLIHDLWPFRDYVIRSFNDDKPIDQLIREHLAGDVLAAGRPEVEIGAAFLVAGTFDDVGNDDAVQAAQIRANALDEMIRATSEAFLGLTVGCARCHDHKFDPITQRDYYGLYATFAAVRHGSRPWATPEEQAAREALVAPLRQRREAAAAEHETLAAQAGPRAPSPADAARQAELAAAIEALDRQIEAIPPLPTAWLGTRDAPQAAQPTRVFLGGDPRRLGEEAPPASLSTVGRAPGYALPHDAAESERRTALADWLTHPANPLPARVLANRVWLGHFGTGIVDTPNDFGFMGGLPTHPELLDWLAACLVAAEGAPVAACTQAGEPIATVPGAGWRLKRLHRLVMTSAAYRQSGAWRPAAGAADAASRWLWRFPPRRLRAEELRDAMLLVAGKLDPRQGGPGFRLYDFQQDNVATYVPLDRHPPETWRRAVYHQNARASVVDLLSDFDQPDCALSAPRRAATTTPLQALTLLNHQFTFEMAQFLAERLEAEAGLEPAAQVERACLLCYNRPPTAEESALLVDFVRSEGLAALGRVLFNSSEILHVP